MKRWMIGASANVSQSTIEAIRPHLDDPRETALNGNSERDRGDRCICTWKPAGELPMCVAAAGWGA